MLSSEFIICLSPLLQRAHARLHKPSPQNRAAAAAVTRLHFNHFHRVRSIFNLPIALIAHVRSRMCVSAFIGRIIGFLMLNLVSAFAVARVDIGCCCCCCPFEFDSKSASAPIGESVELATRGFGHATVVMEAIPGSPTVRLAAWNATLPVSLGD